MKNCCTATGFLLYLPLIRELNSRPSGHSAIREGLNRQDQCISDMACVVSRQGDLLSTVKKLKKQNEDNVILWEKKT